MMDVLGGHTFTAKTSSVMGAATFANRSRSVIALPSADGSTAPAPIAGWGGLVQAAADLALGRREFIATLLAVGAMSATGYRGIVVASKTHRKRCRRKTCPPVAPVQSCIDLCDAGCLFCYRRHAASNLCGGTLSIPGTCVPCTTDNDCPGPAFPYCISAATTLATGETNEFACPGQPAGFCGKPASCCP